MPTRTASGPSASVPRMIFAPVIRLFRMLNLPLPTNLPTSPSHLITPFVLSLTAALQRLDLSRDPRKTMQKVAAHKFTISNTIPLVFMVCSAAYSLYMMNTPSIPFLKYLIVVAYASAAIVPITGQFVWPATPIFAWLVTFFCARYIPSSHRPNIHVNLLPALESVMYGANISDLQTRFTHPILDVIAWIPYGVLHFAIPFIVALLLWVFGPKGSVQYWGRAFGLMNLLGVVTQILLPCAAPCRSSLEGEVDAANDLGYEIIHGLTPATYDMPGSPGGLMRIDRVFHSSGYTNAFGAAPLVFGAFPSLHSGSAVMEALFLSHFFPHLKPLYWAYTGVLWWATMYLSHHYLIDLTGGACLSVVVFYLFMPEAFKDSDQIYDKPDYDLVTDRQEMDLDEEIRKLEENEGQEDEDGDLGMQGDEEERMEGAATRQKQKRSVSWGETKVMGE